MAGKKVYAVKRGFDAKNNIEVKDRIVNTWAQCLELVKGVKNAQYKSFTSIEEAEEYLSEEKKGLKKGEDEYPEDVLHAYVDGSYNEGTEKYSYGLVMVLKGIVMHVDNGAAEDNSMKSIRQIAGELKGAELAAEYAIKNGYHKVVIFHDYVGVCNHALGTWERKEESSKKYFEKMSYYMKEKNLDIIFVKVDSHTGDLYNEIADELAKVAVGIQMKNVSDSIIRKEKLKMASEEIKDKIKVILKKDNYENLLIEGNKKNAYKLEEENIVKEENTKKKNEINSIVKNIAVNILKDEEIGKKVINELSSDVKNEVIFTLISKMARKKK